jgi:ribosome production factor 2
VRYRKSATSKIPEVVLEECGPSMDLAVRRTKLGSDDLRKEASKQPKELKPTKTKNQGTTALKESVGSVHVPRQKMDNLTTKKPRGLKRSRSEATVAGGDETPTKRSKGEN